MFFWLKRVIKHQHDDVYTGLWQRLCHVFQDQGLSSPLRGNMNLGGLLQVRENGKRKDEESGLKEEKEGYTALKPREVRGGIG